MTYQRVGAGKDAIFRGEGVPLCRLGRTQVAVHASFILVILGVVTPETLRKSRGYVIVGAFAIAAVITPPDALSQILLAVPMVILFVVGLVAARAVARRREAEEAKP